MTQKEWEATLDEIIEGFELYMREENGDLKWDTPEEYRALSEKMQYACKLFGEHLLTLWD